MDKHQSITSAISLLLIITIINMNRQCYCVYIYGLVLHNPIPDDLGLKNSLHHHLLSSPVPDQSRNHRYETIDDDDDDNNFSNKGKKNSISFQHHNQQQQKFSNNNRIKCRQDSDCIDDNGPENGPMMYCDQHYSYCDYFRQIGELCRYDSQCDNGLICMFGQCEKPFETGHPGARCKDSDDCNAGLCCARQNGEYICKPKLKHGQQCFVPLGGLDYSLNELCPCDEGLECTFRTKNSRRYVLFTFSLRMIIIIFFRQTNRKRKNENVMRCAFTTSNL
nr:uncharacterized protein LOC124499995 [Dermatophagoides farinae]